MLYLTHKYYSQQDNFSKDLKINAKERAIYKYRQRADSRQPEQIAQADNYYGHIK